MKKLKVNKNYVIEFLIDYGPPTLLSIFWALYIVYQQPEGDFWKVFTKNFVPAFFVLNVISMRVNRTRKSVDKKEKSKVMSKRLDEMQTQLDRIEKLIKEDKAAKDHK